MRLAWKIVRLVASGIVALIAILLLAAVLVTNTSWFRNLARDKANAVLAGTFKGQVAIGRIQGSIWGDLTLDDITLTYNGERIAHIERMRAAYGILALLQSTIDLTHLDLSGLELNTTQDREGKWNAVEALASAHPAAPTKSGEARFRVFVRELSLQRGSIRASLANGKTYALDDTGLGGSVYILKNGLRAKLDSLWGHVAAPGLPPGDIFVALSYQDVIHPASVTIDRAKLDTRDSHLKLTGAISDFASLKTDLRLEATDLSGADIAKIVQQWSPHANLTGTVQIEGARPDLHLTVAMNAVDAKINGDVHADLSHPDPRYVGSLSVVNLNPQQILTTTPATGVANASMRGHGAGTSLGGFTGQAQVHVARLNAQQWNMGDLTATAEIANQVVTYDAQIAQGQRAGATSHGRIDLRTGPTYDIALSTNHLDVQKLQDRRMIRTDLNLAAQITGSGIALANAAATARLNMKPSVLGPVRIDSAVVRASLARGAATFAKASIRAGATRIGAHGQLALNGSQRTSLSYDLQSTNLSPWMTLLGREGGGQLQVIGRANGQFHSLSVNGSASMRSLQTDGTSIGAGKITYALAEVGNDRAHGRIDAGFDQVHTNVDLKSLYVGVDLVRLHPTDARILVDTWDEQSRNQKLAAEVKLSPNVVDVSVSQLMLQLSDGTWRLQQPASMHKDARQIAVQNLRLVNGQRVVSLQGRASFGGAQDVSLRISDFDLSDLNPFIANNPSIAGTLSSSITITGTSSAPIVEAHTQIEPLSMQGYTLREIDANAKYTDGQMVADTQIYLDAASQLTAEATIPMELGWDRRFIVHARGGITGRVHSSGISLTTLNSLAPRTIRGIDGKLSMDLALRGPIKHPAANGGIWLWGGRAKIIPAGVTLDSVNMTVSIAPNAIFLQDLNVRSKDGSIDTWGQIGLESYRPSALDVTLKMDNWPAITTVEYLAYTAANLHLTGTIEAPKIAGSAEVLWGVIKPELDFLNSDKIKEDHTVEVVYDGVAPPPPPPRPPSPFTNLFRNLAIDVLARIHRNTWIRVSGSSAELEGKVHIAKKPEGPLSMAGAIHSVRGQIALIGQPLDLQKGEVTFTGGKEIDPSLDIVAQRQLPQYTVSANIGGTANKPTLTFSSDPTMSQADILSVLMFGKPTSELSNGQQASLQNQAATIASSYAANQIGQSVADALGLSALQFSVESGLASVGTYLTQDVFLSASQNVAPQNQQIPGQPSQKATISYYLTKYLQLDTSQSRSSLGNASELNLTWHTRY